MGDGGEGDSVPPTTDLLTLDELAARFSAAARALYPQSEPRVTFEAPRRAEFGDIATNVAFGGSDMKDVFFTVRNVVYHLKTNVAGERPLYQKP